MVDNITIKASENLQLFNLTDLWVLGTSIAFILLKRAAVLALVA